MNYSMIAYIYCILMEVEAAFMLLPLTVSLIYHEPFNWFAFLIPAAILAVAGLPGIIKKPKDTTIFAREGFVVVSGAWIIMSVFGALPFTISGEIPNYIDALFEMISGFTTTGSSILTNVEGLSNSMLFWRSFSHWIGGMGVLVFIMAIVPLAGGRTMYLMKAESPGPSVGKLKPNVRSTATTLYAIYLFITALEVVLLLLGGMPLFDSLLNSFGSMGTGGFSIKNAGIAAYDSVYIEMVITVFMILGGVNFSLFYLIATGGIIQALKSEELHVYIGVIVSSTLLIAINILSLTDGIGQALRYAVFQVSSVITTTGFATTDFNLWPEFSRAILLMLMFLGAMAGSTGGGLKISRLILLVKSSIRDVRRALHPRAVQPIHFERKVIDENVISGVSAYFVLYILVIAASFLLVSLDKFDFETGFTAVVSCFNNIGPGFGDCGPYGSFASFSVASKIVLSLDMLLGRLEIIPMVMLFSPAVWKRSYKSGGKK